MNGEDYTPILNVIKQRKIDIQNISKPMQHMWKAIVTQSGE